MPAFLLAAALCLVIGLNRPAAPDVPKAIPAPSTAPDQSAPEVPPAAAPAPAGLPVFSYRHAPSGFPADPQPESAAAVTEALHLSRQVAVYDAPGGRPRAFLPAQISGVPITVPILERRPGWAAVLLPSVNRRIGWLPESVTAKSATVRTLHDQLLLRLASRELTWLRDGVRQGSWTVAIGAKATPTPLGRTFIFGHTTPRGSAYAGLDAIVLGAVPDDPNSVAPGLQGGHTAIHGWYQPSVFGHDISNGCIRAPSDGVRRMLDEIPAGTTLVVLTS